MKQQPDLQTDTDATENITFPQTQTAKNTDQIFRGSILLGS